MLRLRMLRTDGKGDAVPNGIAQFADGVASDYQPLLGGSLRFQASTLGLPSRELAPMAADAQQYGQATAFAEIFAVSSGLVALRLSQFQQGVVMEDGAPRMRSADEWMLQLYGIGQEETEKDLGRIASRMEEHFGLNLKPFSYRSNRLKELKQEGMDSPVPPTAEQEKGAVLLSDRAARAAAIGIAASGGLLVQDVEKQLPKELQPTADEARRQLLDHDLVCVELVVTCSRTSSQVARVPSREALEEAARSGIKCACGRDIMDERVDEALTITALGRELLNGSYWMSILLMNELRDLGVPYESMLIEQKSGGDEMDCIADLSGELSFFELKDKEFNLGNAYSFGAKVGIIRPEHSVIVTSAYVGNDAKRALQAGGVVGANGISVLRPAEEAEAEAEEHPIHRGHRSFTAGPHGSR